MRFCCRAKCEGGKCPGHIILEDTARILRKPCHVYSVMLQHFGSEVTALNNDPMYKKNEQAVKNYHSTHIFYSAFAHICQNSQCKKKYYVCIMRLIIFNHDFKNQHHRCVPAICLKDGLEGEKYQKL